MPNPNLAPAEPSAYRWAVHCCAYKFDLSRGPERPVALFEHESVAHSFDRHCSLASGRHQPAVPP